MSTANEAKAQAISLTEKAADRILAVIAGEKPGSMLRVSVAGGGCSGFQYVFDIDSEKGPDDIVIQRGGATVLVIGASTTAVILAVVLLVVLL